MMSSERLVSAIEDSSDDDELGDIELDQAIAQAKAATGHGRNAV